MAIALVTSTPASAGANGSIINVTLGATAPVGSTIVVCIAIRSGSAQAVNSVTDNASGGSNTYGAITSASISATTNQLIWAAKQITKTCTVVTVTLAVANSCEVSVAVYSGVVDVISGSSTTGTGANPSISTTIDDADNWVVGGFAGASSTVPTAGTGNLRTTAGRGSGSSQIYSALVDNTSSTQGASVTTSITHASATWSSTSVELIANRQPVVGSITVASDPPPVGISLPTVAGSAALTGNQPTVAQTIFITPSAGSLTLTGQLASISSTAGTDITPTVGALTLTGNQPTQSIAIIPSAGSATATGTTPGITTTTVITPITAIPSTVPFDLGFDFRFSAGFVTDPAYGVPVLGEVFPHTYTNANGKSINAGWNAGITHTDRLNTNDPRIAGMNFASSGAQFTFTVDLSTGSAPGIGPFNVDMAIGDPSASRTPGFQLLDNTTILLAQSGITTLSGHFFDATLADVAATTTWTGTPRPFAFATTSVKFIGNFDAGATQVTSIAHLRLTGGNPSLVLTGQTPSVVQTTVIQPGAGSLTLTGQTPTQSITITPSSGSVTVTGNSPATNVNAAPDTGSLTLTGNAPVIVQTNFITPNTGSLNVTGQQAILSSPLVPNAGSLTLTGNAPVLAFGIVVGTAVGSGGGASFDMGFNFRATAGFVTDQAYAVPMLAEVYPHTYTNGNGDSINAGWLNAAENKVDRSAANDPRLAGIGFGGTNDFRIDLDSGTAPGAGDYAIDFAAGDQGGTQTIGFEVRDTGTGLITVPSQSVAAGHFLDATVTNITASTNWTGTPVTKTFATTVCLVHQTGSAIFLAHFRLTKAGGSGSSLDVTGQTPTEVLTTVIQPNAGSATLTGNTTIVGVSLVPDAGSLTLTGQQPTVSTGATTTNITPDTGSLTLTGNQPTLAFGVVPDSGSLTITGQTPTLLISTFITPNAGSLTLIGQTSTPLVSSFITPNVGSLTLTGNQPSLSTTTFITPNAGSATITGNAPTVETATLLTPNAGSLTLTGQTPILLQSVEITPNAGSLTLTGQTPSLFLQDFITPNAGSLTLTGFPPSLGNNPNIAPDTGTLTLTGAQPTIQMSVVPSTGSATVTGGAVTLSTALIPNAGSLTLTGNAPTLVTDTLITPNAGSLTVTGNTPTLLISTFITPSAGSLTLTGQTPALTQETRITPTVGALALTGQTPALLVSTFIAPSAGSLTLTGQTAVVQTGSPGIITPNTGAVSVTGNQPTQSLGDFVTAGSLTLTGGQPTVSQGSTITPNTGSASITGGTVTLTLGIVPSAGAATVTDNAPTQSMQVFTNTGSLTLTGNQPVALSGAFATPNTGALTLTGEQPVVQSQPQITPGTGSLTIIGQTPTVEEIRLNITPNTGVVTITGNAPTVNEVGLEITPGTGAVTITGEQPRSTRRRVKVIKYRTVIHPTMAIRTRIPRRGIVRR